MKYCYHSVLNMNSTDTHLWNKLLPNRRAMLTKIITDSRLTRKTGVENSAGNC